MKLKNVKRKVALVLTLAMASTSVITTAFATPKVFETSKEGVVDMGMGGDAVITVKGVTDGTAENQSIINKKFRLYQIFEATNAKDGESINYDWNEDYKESIQKVVSERLKAKGQDVNSEDVTEYMAIDYIQTLNTNPVEGTTTPQEEESREGNGFRLFVEELRDQLETDGKEPLSIMVKNAELKNNSFKITNIPFGFYILDEVTKPGTHSAASLCMATTANGNIKVNLKSDYPEVTKFIQENEEGWREEGGYDFEIGQTVKYKLESVVPDIRGYHKYTYNYHDLLDDAITFNEDSVKIEIKGNVDEESKTYTLNPEEFQVNVIKSDEETFEIAIDDIKAIIDREFPNFNDKEPAGENEYNQSVVVTYTGTVNDQASTKEGNPGLTNKVWLEYSFDPDGNGVDSTTNTPPTYVKAYTYSLDLTKVNNHDKQLAGAEFKLYSDEDLENEILVKKAGDGYHVINRDNAGGTDKVGGTSTSDAMVSDAQGKVVIHGLDSDEYWLVETKAPDGYRRILDPIHIVITSRIGGTGELNTIEELSATYDMKTFYNGSFINKEGEELEADKETGIITMEIVNEVGKKLPVTGTTAGLIIFVIGVGAIGTAVVMNKKKKAN